MDITLAKKENIEDLYRIWNNCFGDDNETIDAFFKFSFDFDNTLVAIQDGRVISALYMLNETIVANNKSYSAYYLYALGTDPDYRKRGIMAQLLENATRLAKERDADYLFLVPASEKLFEYYERLGFVNAFCQKKLVLKKQVIDRLKSVDKFNEIEFNSNAYRNVKRENIIATNSNMLEKSFVDWNESEIDLANCYFKSGNGETITTDFGSCFIEHANMGDKIYDLNCDEKRICDMLGVISTHIISDSVEFYMSKNFSLIGNGQEFYNCGMIKKLKQNLDDLENTFMGITLQ